MDENPANFEVIPGQYHYLVRTGLKEYKVECEHYIPEDSSEIYHNAMDKLDIAPEEAIGELENLKWGVTLFYDSITDVLGGSCSKEKKDEIIELIKQNVPNIEIKVSR